MATPLIMKVVVDMETPFGKDAIGITIRHCWVLLFLLLFVQSAGGGLSKNQNQVERC